MATEGHKRCTKCGETKPREMFSKQLERLHASLHAKRRAIKRGAAIGAISSATWAQLQNDCAVFQLLCGVSFQIDHVRALAAGGAHGLANFDVIPARANTSKGARRIEDLRPGTIAWDYYHGPDVFEHVTFRSFHSGTECGP